MQINGPVVVTRPLTQCQPLASRIEALGYRAVVFPLLEILPLADTTALQAALDELASYALIAFVSPNAIAAAFALRPDWPQGQHLAVMGEGSRKALASHGIDARRFRISSPRDPLRTDSQTLLETLDLAALRGQRVLIIRGESGRELLADALRGAGAIVTQVAAYRRCAPQADAPRLRELAALLDAPANWIVTSSEALRFLHGMAGHAAIKDGVAKLQRQQLIVPHQRIQETARLLGFQHIVLTGSGDGALLAALQS